jgi:copper chaperone CopZ
MIKNLFALLVVVCAMTVSTTFAADYTVTLSDVHMCCGNCVKGVDAALTSVTGAKGVGSQEKTNIVITAPDQATAQKAVNALVMAGYFGKSSDAAIKVDAPSNAPAGSVKTMSVSGVHLCCGKCVTAVKDVVAKVNGAKAGDDLKQKATSFTVTGDYNAANLFAELNKAGLAGHAGDLPKP